MSLSGKSKKVILLTVLIVITIGSLLGGIWFPPVFSITALSFGGCIALARNIIRKKHDDSAPQNEAHGDPVKPVSEPAIAIALVASPTVHFSYTHTINESPGHTVTETESYNYDSVTPPAPVRSLNLQPVPYPSLSPP